MTHVPSNLRSKPTGIRTPLRYPFLLLAEHLGGVLCSATCLRTYTRQTSADSSVPCLSTAPLLLELLDLKRRLRDLNTTNQSGWMA